MNDETVLYGVCANKSDLASEKTIPDEKGKEYAKKIGAEWTSTSAIINGKGIDKFVEKLFIKYYNTNFNMTNTPSLSITLSSEKTKVEKKVVVEVEMIKLIKILIQLRAHKIIKEIIFHYFFCLFRE